MIKITTESTADLEHLFESEGIERLPLYVDLDGKTYLDGVDIKAEDIFKKYEEKRVLPKTAARGIEEYVEFFTDVKARHGADEIIHISISSELSASYSNALKAASQVQGVTVIDSRSLSSGIGLLVLKAKDLVSQGKTSAEVVEIINDLVPYTQASFVVDTMEYLHKGGRCTGLVRLITTVLKIKSMLLLKNGKIEVGQKYRGPLQNCITKYVEAILKQHNTPDFSRIFITHTHVDPQIVQGVKEQIQELMPEFKQIIETKAGCTITAHCGKNTLGILYINKPL